MRRHGYRLQNLLKRNIFIFQMHREAAGELVLSSSHGPICFTFLLLYLFVDYLRIACEVMTQRWEKKSFMRVGEINDGLWLAFNKILEDQKASNQML